MEGMAPKCCCVPFAHLLLPWELPSWSATCCIRVNKIPKGPPAFQGKDIRTVLPMPATSFTKR